MPAETIRGSAILGTRPIRTALSGENWRKTVEDYEQPPLDEVIDAELREFVGRGRIELATNGGHALRISAMRVAGILFTLALALGVGLSPGSKAVAAPAVRTVAPAPALARSAMASSRLPAAAAVHGTVVLKVRDQAALRRLIATVSDPRSPGYGRFLAPGEFAARFGPATTTISAVEAQLRGAGLRIAGLSRSRMLIRFSGTARAVGSAFHTSLMHYRLRTGALAQGTASAVRLPSRLAGSIAAVLGLDTLAPAHPAGVPHPLPADVGRHRAARSGAFAHPSGSPRPCAAARTASVGADGLTDDQIANAYGAFGLYAQGDRGSGQRIALYENEPFLRSDIATFDACYFGAARARAMLGRLHSIAVDGGQPQGPGSGEASLDIEDVSAMAPGAAIDVYEGPYAGPDPSTNESLDEYAAIVDADRDRIVSTSWGLCEQAVQRGQPGLQQAENLLFEQAAAQGQTVFSAAGDNGSDDCNLSGLPFPKPGQDPVSVDDPASQPYVVAVGGSAIDDASTRPPLEQVWNGGPTGGSGGGGISQSWPMPGWQRAPLIGGSALPGGADYRAAEAVQRTFGYPTGFCDATAPGSGGATPCRLLPDVSAQADSYTGSITVYSRTYAGTSYSSNGWTTTGGTSSSAPIWAAMEALVTASPACAESRLRRRGLGFLAPQLYAVASDPARYRASFHDIVTGNNDVDGLHGVGLFSARRGFDLATGLGSPQLTGPRGTAGLAYYLCSGARGERPVVSGLSPSQGGVAGGERVTITGAGFGRGVSAVQIGSRRLTPGRFRVLSPTSILATLPAAGGAPYSPAPQDGAGPASVIVTAGNGQSSVPGPRSTFDYVDDNGAGAIPSVVALVPSGGSETAPGAVTILGEGFREATAVTFGGVPATRVDVVSSRRIRVTPPPYSRATACAPLPRTGVYAGEGTGNDICQVHVQVSDPAGASRTSRILAPVQGAISTDALGETRLHTGCGCEGAPAPDEYDYVPPPRITSVSTSEGPAALASEHGDTLITVHGSGLDPLALYWADFGNPSRADSVDTRYAYLSGTEMQIVARSQPRTLDRLRVALSVRTLAGQSPPVGVTYAGVPKLTAVIDLRDRDRLDGAEGASDAGGTPIRVLGRGLAGQLVGPVGFLGAQYSSLGTEYDYRIRGATALDTVTVGQTPGLVHVSVCTVTGCNPQGRADRLWLYAPGQPRVTSVTPRTGPPAGRTRVAIHGVNLDCALAVYFGHRRARPSSPGFGVCGPSEAVKTTSPPGVAGSVVPVRVLTVGSYFSGRRLGAGSAKFAYARRSAAR